MCGIVGFNWEDKSLVKKMADLLSHRGPDDSGTYTDRNISLGHRRLSIIDLSKKGHQPMFNEDNSLVVVFNGEIYNFKELKQNLTEKKNTDLIVLQTQKSFFMVMKNMGPEFLVFWTECLQSHFGMQGKRDFFLREIKSAKSLFITILTREK